MREGLKDRIKKETETPERIQGEIIDTEWEGLPDGIGDMINNAIYDFCNFENTPPIEDMKKEKQLVWSACCMYIGRKVYKKNGLLRKAEREPGGQWIGYDMRVIWASVPLWAYLCTIYGKAPFAYDFEHFTGLSSLWLYDKSKELLTPEREQLTKKLKEIQETGLAGLIADGAKNPTGAIAILNHWHGWAQNQIVVQTDTQKALTAASLPLLGENNDFSRQIAQEQMFDQERTQAEKAPQSP